MLSSRCNKPTIISYFGKCEYDCCFHMLEEHGSNLIKSVNNLLLVQIVSYCIGKKTFQEILYIAILDHLLRYIGSKSGRKLVLGATVAYSRDLNLRTNYFSIVSFCLYA